MSTIPERIKKFNGNRQPYYTALKYQQMAENAFRFFRGTCHLYYEDLSSRSNLPPYPISWVCGDLHLENFGSYKGENRLVYFDVNDFDEGLLAPVDWEVSRIVTSIFTSFDSLGIKKKEAAGMAEYFLRIYCQALIRGKARYLEPATSNGIVRIFLEKVALRKQKELIRQRTEEGKNGNLRLRLDKVRFYPIEKTLRKSLMTHLGGWMQQEPLLKGRYQVLDACFRVAGTGGLGLKRYVFLVRNNKDPKKHLLIDMKQAQTSSLAPWVKNRQPDWESEAARIVTIQDRMQNVSPALLSTATYEGESYVIKELQPTADKIDFLVIRDRYKDIACVLEDMAFLTASAELRSAGRQHAATPDELIAFGKDNSWQSPLLEYAETYSVQVKKDYQEYFTAYKDGYFS